ncbi:Monoacylglycerol lipase [Leucobacter aridicollis]|uniref:alpha/beta fold hydrolase n=1 Tax=Leucobacter aridicollis TaxID=283878 RepID=UPI000EAD87C3|nr:alpha/beta hydrolase [Leucobacter aridicollis]MCS3429235.1 alpha-beta hydrolase superfamily lysophospholipase [Leucobacter aridicollis]RKQ85839.1 alpha-beta hydrolase superfamily lysophospholipase [Mycolicibacterium mucogenicum 261Sha1.1M5]
MNDQHSPGRRDFTYTDAHGIEISAYAWLPDPDRRPEPVGAVQIAHGIGEHALRYDGFARFLARAGLAVYANDHRGHGETGRRQHGGDLSLLGKLGPGGLRAAEGVIRQLTEIIRTEHPGLRVAQLGHSWGSLMTQRILNEAPRQWDAVVLSGSAYRTPRFMESGNLNANWAGVDGANGFEWLSRDPETAAAFIADPLCFEANILKLFGVSDGLRLFGTPGPGLAVDVPLLIVSGSDDPLSRADGLKRLADAYRARGVRDVALKIYPGARHELLQETNRDAVYTDLATWLLEHVE